MSLQQCQNCGLLNHEDAAFCKMCRARLYGISLTCDIPRKRIFSPLVVLLLLSLLGVCGWWYYRTREFKDATITGPKPIKVYPKIPRDSMPRLCWRENGEGC